MQPDLRSRLEHVIAAGNAIVRITRGKTFADYAADEVLAEVTQLKEAGY